MLEGLIGKQRRIACRKMAPKPILPNNVQLHAGVPVCSYINPYNAGAINQLIDSQDLRIPSAIPRLSLGTIKDTGAYANVPMDPNTNARPNVPIIGGTFVHQAKTKKQKICKNPENIPKIGFGHFLPI